MKIRLNRNTLVNWGIFFISSMVTLFLIELMMRLIYPACDPRGRVQFSKNENGVVTAEPNFEGRQWKNSGDFDVSISINQYGFRDSKDFRNAKSEDIFLIGDSFSFGHGVEEENRFSNVMQKLTSDSIQIFNLGISGTHFLHYEKSIHYAKENGATIKNIIIGVCMENDILDYASKLENPNRKNNIGIKEWLSRKSTLYNFIAIQLQTNEKLRTSFKKLGLINDELKTFPFAPFSEREINSSLVQLKALIADYNSLVVLIPSRLNWIADRKEDANSSHQRWKKVLEENQIPYLDLKPFLDQYSADPLKTLFFQNDGHWNVQGHEIVASAILKEWMDRNKKHPIKK